MATYRAVGTGGGSSGTGNRTADIVALAGDHLTCFVQWAGNTNTTPTCSDNQGGTYDLITTALCNASADIQACFVRRQAVATAATITVTPVVGAGSNTSGEVFVIACAGMTRMGTNSIRQSARQQNQTSGVPTPVFGSSALTGNLTIVCHGASNGTQNALAVPNASWTERADAGQTANVSNLEIATRDSGFTGTSAAYVSTTATLWNSTFVELDASNAGFFGREQWPVPEGYKLSSSGQRQNNLITWSEGLLQSTLAPITYLPRSPLYTQRGVPPFTPFGLTQGNLLDSTLGQVQAPFSETDWPNPRGAQFTPEFWDANTLPLYSAVVAYLFRGPLYAPRGQIRPGPIDEFLNLNVTTLGQVQTPFEPLDWPVPRGAAALVPAWADQTRINLIGRDTLPEPNLDWPVPKGFTPVIDLRTWVESTLNLLGQDQLPEPNLDWPNPRGYTPLVRDWFDHTRIQLIGKDTLPFPNEDWPNPRGPQYPQQHAAGTLLTALLLHPVAQRDWPVPYGRIPAIDLKTWTESTLNLAGQDVLPFPNRDWPNPRWPVYPHPPSVVSLLGTLLLVTQNPFYQLDWPNPYGPKFAIQLREWIDATRIELIGKDQLPFDQTNWPVPAGKIPASVLATWVNLLQQQLIGKDTLPFNQDNWPVPWSTKPNQWPPLNPFNPNLPPTPPSADQLRQRIRFAPIAFGGTTHWTR